MSNAKSALPDARFEGIANVTEASLVGMITIRGDFSSKPFAKAVEAVAGCKLPDIRKINAGSEGRMLAWMSPDELLLVTDHGSADSDVTSLVDGFGDEHALAVNVSDARAVFSIAGAGARETIGKVAPVDMSVSEFGVGDFRRTRFAQVPAAFWMQDDGGFQVVCFRSVAQYMFDLLSVAAQEGSEVGIY